MGQVSERSVWEMLLLPPPKKYSFASEKATQRKAFVAFVFRRGVRGGVGG